MYREEMKIDGNSDVDVVITTRELARMIKQSAIDFKNLQDNEFDSILGISTGAGVIFGNTGGVMEAALRTVSDILTGQDLQTIDYTAVRGIEGIREATVNIDKLELKVAMVNGTANASKLLEKIRTGEDTTTLLK